MKSWKMPTNKMVDKALSITIKMTTRRYFFQRLKNPLWIKPLAERGRFKYPPKSVRFDDGTVRFPYWPEFQYLKNVCTAEPEQVIDIVMQLPRVDNPVVYDAILNIAVQLPGEQSVKLKPKILEYTEIEFSYQTHKYADLLAHWTTENRTDAALELAKRLVPFAPDPQFQKKHERWKNDPTGSSALLYPEPKIGDFEYDLVMSKGVLPLAESEPMRTARLLICATADMLSLRTLQDDPYNKEDYSDTWCSQLTRDDRNHGSPEKTLVQTLTFACEKVFEKSPEQIEELDKLLRQQRWKLFRRLRHHLYARYRNDHTLPYIRDEILTYQDYNRSAHSYEFQQMIRSACEHFGETLLTIAERVHIFEAILEGPSKENYRHWIENWCGETFTEERYEERQERFRRKQFSPFAPVLFGKYAAIFKRLEADAEAPISDGDYLSVRTQVGSVSKQRPRTPEYLANFSDDRLLDFINAWETEQTAPFVEISVEKLAESFQTFFRTFIMADIKRLQFWLENRGNIKRPIYVRMMLRAMQAEIEAKCFDRLDTWLGFCEWVLTHPDTDHEIGDNGPFDTSREEPRWSFARQAVLEVIETCLKQNVPITARTQLAKLLTILCTQFDSRLDAETPTAMNGSDPFMDGSNTTRGRVLQALMSFGFWMRRHDPAADLHDIKEVLEERLSRHAEPPLTFPEHAMLGGYYRHIFQLDKTWALTHKTDIFPQESLQTWRAAFEGLLGYSEAFLPLFEVLRDDFSFALKHLSAFKKYAHSDQEAVDRLGQHLFIYYLWGLYPLNGEASLLAQYYHNTEHERERWASLFHHIGRRLQGSGDTLDADLKARAIAFFAWRIEQQEPTEFRLFTPWLQAKCLDVGWRLDAYAKVLDISAVENPGFHIQMLADLIPAHTAEVLRCFVKLTEWIKDKNTYVPSAETAAILNAGQESRNRSVRQNAEQSRENLLRAGHFEFLDNEA